MSPMRMEDNERRKPLAFDPSTSSFLFIDDVKQGRMVAPSSLDADARKKLVIRRLELSGAFSIESLEAADCQRQIKEVRDDTPMGRDIVKAEINNLSELIEDIRRGDIV